MVKAQLKYKWNDAITKINALERELFKRRREVYSLAMKGLYEEAKEIRDLNFLLKKEIHKIRCCLWRYEEEYLFD